MPFRIKALVVAASLLVVLAAVLGLSLYVIGRVVVPREVRNYLRSVSHRLGVRIEMERVTYDPFSGIHGRGLSVSGGAELADPFLIIRSLVVKPSVLSLLWGGEVRVAGRMEHTVIDLARGGMEWERLKGLIGTLASGKGEGRAGGGGGPFKVRLSTLLVSDAVLVLAPGEKVEIETLWIESVERPRGGRMLEAEGVARYRGRKIEVRAVAWPSPGFGLYTVAVSANPAALSTVGGTPPGDGVKASRVSLVVLEGEEPYVGGAASVADGVGEVTAEWWGRYDRARRRLEVRRLTLWLPHVAARLQGGGTVSMAAGGEGVLVDLGFEPVELGLARLGVYLESLGLEGVGGTVRVGGVRLEGTLPRVLRVLGGLEVSRASFGLAGVGVARGVDAEVHFEARLGRGSKPALKGEGRFSVRGVEVPGVTAAVKGDASFTARGRAVSATLSGLKADLLGGELRGDVSIERAGGAYSASAHLAGGGLELGRLRPLFPLDVSGVVRSLDAELVMEAPASCSVKAAFTADGVVLAEGGKELLQTEEIKTRSPLLVRCTPGADSALELETSLAYAGGVFPGGIESGAGEVAGVFALGGGGVRARDLAFEGEGVGRIEVSSLAVVPSGGGMDVEFSGLEWAAPRPDVAAAGVEGRFAVRLGRGVGEAWEAELGATSLVVPSARCEALRASARREGGRGTASLDATCNGGPLTGSVRFDETNGSRRVSGGLRYEDGLLALGGGYLSVGGAELEFDLDYGSRRCALPSGKVSFSVAGLVPESSEGTPPAYAGVLSVRGDGETITAEGRLKSSVGRGDLELNGSLRRLGCDRMELDAEVPPFKLGPFGPLASVVAGGLRVSGGAAVRARGVVALGSEGGAAGWEWLRGGVKLDGVSVKWAGRLRAEGVRGEISFAAEKPAEGELGAHFRLARSLDELRTLAKRYPRDGASPREGGLLEADSLALGPVAVEDVRLRAVLSPGGLGIYGVRGSLFGGRLYAEAALASGPRWRYDTTVYLHRVSLKEFTSALGMEGYMTGRLSGVARLRGAFGSWDSIGGYVGLWSVRSEEERTIGRAMLRRLGMRGKLLLGSSKRYDRARAYGVIRDGMLTLRTFDISHSIFWVKDLSIRINPDRNTIALSDLVSVIEETRRRVEEGGLEFEVEKK